MSTQLVKFDIDEFTKPGTEENIIPMQIESHRTTHRKNISSSYSSLIPRRRDTLLVQTELPTIIGESEQPKSMVVQRL